MFLALSFKDIKLNPTFMEIITHSWLDACTRILTGRSKTNLSIEVTILNTTNKSVEYY